MSALSIMEDVHKHVGTLADPIIAPVRAAMS